MTEEVKLAEDVLRLTAEVERCNASENALRLSWSRVIAERDDALARLKTAMWVIDRVSEWAPQANRVGELGDDDAAWLGGILGKVDTAAPPKPPGEE